MSKRVHWRSHEEQVAAWHRVKQLKRDGFPNRAIAAEVGISHVTVYNWLSRTVPPIGLRGSGASKQPTRTFPWIDFSSKRRSSCQIDHERGKVPADVALLRDQLVAAFVRGDLTEHARLTLMLTARLDALVVTVEPVEITLSPVIVLEAAE